MASTVNSGYVYISSATSNPKRRCLVFLRVVAAVEEKRAQAEESGCTVACTAVFTACRRPPSSAPCFAAAGEGNAALLPLSGAESVQVGQGCPTPLRRP